jgi:hypothetical protein
MYSMVWPSQIRMIVTMDYYLGTNQYDSNLWELRLNDSGALVAGGLRKLTSWTDLPIRSESLSTDGKKLVFIRSFLGGMALLSSESLPSLLTVSNCSGVPEKRTGPAQGKTRFNALYVCGVMWSIRRSPSKYALQMNEQLGASVWPHANAMGTCIPADAPLEVMAGLRLRIPLPKLLFRSSAAAGPSCLPLALNLSSLPNESGVFELTLSSGL